MTLTKQDSIKFKDFIHHHIDEVDINDGDKLFLLRHLYRMMDKYTISGNGEDNPVYVAAQSGKNNGDSTKYNATITQVEEDRLAPQSYNHMIKLVTEKVKAMKEKFISADIKSQLRKDGWIIDESNTDFSRAFGHLSRTGVIKAVSEIRSPDPKHRSRRVKLWMVA